MFKITSSLFIVCIIHLLCFSTALTPFRLVPRAPRIKVHFHVNPPSGPSSQSKADAAASTIQPTLPSDIPAANTVSSPTNATISAPPDKELNNIAESSSLLDEGNAVLANNTSDPASHGTHCWSSEQIYPIQHPIDCFEASRLIYQEGPAFTPVTWSGSKEWVSGSCALLLMPDKAEAEDVFFRFDIVAAVSQVQNKCVNSEHGYRGGYTGIGLLNEFHVSVQAR